MLYRFKASQLQERSTSQRIAAHQVPCGWLPLPYRDYTKVPGRMARIYGLDQPRSTKSHDLRCVVFLGHEVRKSLFTLEEAPRSPSAPLRGFSKQSSAVVRAVQNDITRNHRCSANNNLSGAELSRHGQQQASRLSKKPKQNKEITAG